MSGVIEELIDETRQEMAIRMLKIGKLSDGNVAFYCGLSLSQIMKLKAISENPQQPDLDI